jgi:hypothetical protein
MHKMTIDDESSGPGLLVLMERSDVNLRLRVLLLGPRLNPERVTSQGGIICGMHETRCCASNVVDFRVLVLYLEAIGTSQSRYWPWYGRMQAPRASALV